MQVKSWLGTILESLIILDCSVNIAGYNIKIKKN